MVSKYRSKLEGLTAKLLEKNKLEFEYEPKPIPYYSKVRGGRCTKCTSKDVVRKRSYLPDFVLASGRVVESKGILSPPQRTKFLDIAKSNPDLDVYFVFGADNKLAKHSKLRYSDWCKRHGFDYGVKALPASLIRKEKAAARSDGTT